MRVISGKYKGRILKGYDILGTRPTMDRVKESVFAMIQDYLNDSVVLDLFSGSGNYGIEALSNGAKRVYFNDYNKKCIQVIKDNLNNCNLEESCVITNLDYLEALNYYKKNSIKFDLIFLDPPYQKYIINEILDKINKNELLNKKALIICETTDNKYFVSEELCLFKERQYGDKKIVIYQKI